MASSLTPIAPFLPVTKQSSFAQKHNYTTKTPGSPNLNESTTHPTPFQSPTQSSTPNILTHLTTDNTVHMVTLDPSKPTTQRTATARATILFSNPTPLRLIREASLKKGDVSAVARIAGIMAAKRTSDLIPLCHNIPLSGVTVDVLAVSQDDYGEWKAGDGAGVLDAEVGEFGGVMVEATVRCNGATGVEMEALSAVTAAGLTVYDMCKAVDKGMRIEGVRVVRKSGGRSGDLVEGRAMVA